MIISLLMMHYLFGFGILTWPTWEEAYPRNKYSEPFTSDRWVKVESQNEIIIISCDEARRPNDEKPSFAICDKIGKIERIAK